MTPNYNYGQPEYAQGYSSGQGYAYREGLASSSTGTPSRVSKTAFMKSKWPRNFMLVTLVQAIVCLAFEAYTFGRFQTSVRDIDTVGLAGEALATAKTQLKTIPTFLTLFIFGFLYELVVVWDALCMKNTIQVIGVCAANVALLIYTALQIVQIEEAMQGLQSAAVIAPGNDVWGAVQGYLIAIPIIIAVGTVGMAFVAWKLYQEFAWDILKTIGADYRMKKRFLHYQIYIALLKFDFFFFLGFIVQFLVIVTTRTDIEMYLTIVTIPITILILLGAVYFVRNENKPGMVCTIILYFGGLTYFLFKLARIYQPATEKSYFPVRKSLTAFAVVTIILILLTITNAIMCMMNFGAGLKNHIKAKPRDIEKPDANSISMHDVKPATLPSRMTID